MSMSNITLFNKMTGMQDSTIFEALLDTHYTKFKEIYNIINILPKKYINNIQCAEFTENKLIVTIDVVLETEVEKVYKKVNTKIYCNDEFTITAYISDNTIIILIEDTIVD